MNWFIALIPALGWGIMPIIAQMTKGNPREQLTGTTITALFFALLLYLYSPAPLEFLPFIISFVSGILWSLGQLLQFQSFQVTSVAKAIPIICGLQLTGTTLFAAIVFNEWEGISDLVVGTFALITILIGIFLLSFQEKQRNSSRGFSLHLFMVLLFSALALSSYVIINQLFGVSGFEVVLPQAFGMFFSSLVINSFSKNKLCKQKVMLNLLTGLSWSIANLSLFIANGTLGIAKSFPLSQASIIIATLGGIVIFKEKKKHREWLAISVGILSVMAGVCMISFIKNI
ncbi:GRP family sugar transporter [Neobacillus niacini]|uniref:GRP family sugar transporter n=1 Tax=Neobacillus niacini TaxID=86668 RepID=UPI001C8E5C5E|nr:GRP family sugar transporter [Neobacillus niacini]MBY0148434.1 sugar transporter [Neobacillus niacini]